MKNKRVALLAASVAAMALLVAPAARAADVTTLRVGDLNCSDTRLHGHNDFQAHRIHVFTDGNLDIDGVINLDKAACYFALPSGATLGTIGEPTMDWTVKATGPYAIPGQQLVLADGALLVGEPVYNGASTGDPNGDWWLTSGSPSADKLLAPSCDGTAETVTDPGSHCSSGSGTYWHGTLDQWRTALGDDVGAIAGGWSLGSGVYGDGYLNGMTYGDSAYEFTSSPAATPTNATAYDHTTTACRTVKVNLGVNTLTADQAPGADTNVKVKVTVDNHAMFGPVQMTYGQIYVQKRTFSQRQDPSTVRVKFDGVLVGLYNVPRNCTT